MSARRASKLWLLVKVQLTAFFGVNRLLSSLRRGKSADKIGGKSLAVLVVAAISVYAVWISWFYSNGMAQAMLAVGGRMDIVPAMMVAAASLMTLFTGILSAGRVLLSYRDYDLVMSLPVSSATVAASRILVLYVYELIISIILTVPAAAVYAKYVRVPALFWPVYILCVLAVPLIPLVISSALGTLVTVLSARAKRLTTLAGIVLSLAIVLIIVIVSMQAGQSAAAMASQLEGLYASIVSRWPPTEMFVRAACGQSLLNLLAFLVLSIGCFAAFCLVISAHYKRICSAVSAAGTVTGRASLRIKSKAGSQLSALYFKEMRRYFSSTVYVLNTSAGLVMAVAICVMLLARGFSLFGISDPAAVALIRGLTETAAPTVLGIFVCMSCTTGSSVSLEGRNLWIAASAPVSASRILIGKALVNLTLTVPASLVCAVLLTLALGLNGIRMALVFIVPPVYALYSAALGLFINLRLPKLDWTSETQIVKRSLASMISSLGGPLAPLIVTFAAVGARGSGTLIIAATTALIFAAALGLSLYLRSKGDSLMKSLWDK